jgi:hypothetical protein
MSKHSFRLLKFYFQDVFSGILSSLILSPVYMYVQYIVYSGKGGCWVVFGDHILLHSERDQIQSLQNCLRRRDFALPFMSLPLLRVIPYTVSI